MIRERDGDMEIYITVYCTNSETAADLKQLQLRDKNAEYAIKECEGALKVLKAYREELNARAQELMRMKSSKRITLRRERDYYSNRVYYRLITEEVYEDGSEHELSRTTYEGKDRHKAIADFNAMKKQYPQFEYIFNIEKGRWEK